MANKKIKKAAKVKKTPKTSKPPQKDKSSNTSYDGSGSFDLGGGVKLIVGKTSLGYFHEKYLEWSNPLYVWYAYKLCRDYNHKIPEWISQYFDESAKNLARIKSPESRASALAYEALGMNKMGKGTPFSDFYDVELGIKVANRVKEIKDERKSGPGNQLVEIYIEVAEELSETNSAHISEFTVKKYYQKYKNFDLNINPLI